MQIVKPLYGRKIKKWSSGEHTINLFTPAGPRNAGVERYIEGEYFGLGGVTVNLTTSGLVSSSFVTTPSIGQIHKIDANDIQASSYTEASSLHQEHKLEANSISSASSVGKPLLIQVQITIDLIATPISSSSYVDKSSIGQIHALDNDNINSDSYTDTPSITIISNLIAQDIYADAKTSSPSFKQIQVLLANNTYSDSSVGQPSITSGPSISFGNVLISGIWHKCDECYICIGEHWYGVTEIDEVKNEVWKKVIN